MITIRIYRPEFHRDEVLDYVDIPRWPRSVPHRVQCPEVRQLLHKYDSKGLRFTRRRQSTYLLWLLSPEFSFSARGLYLTDWGAGPPSWEQVNSHGRFDSEGLTNHVHLSDITTNRVAQFEIGVRAIRAWVPALCHLQKLQSVVIYLNGPHRFTVCLYGDPTSEALRVLERRLPKCESLRKMSATAFLKWALNDSNARNLTRGIQPPRRQRQRRAADA